MKTKNLVIIFALTCTSMLWGCYPGGPDYIDQYDLVYTNHDEAYSFKGKKNYSIPDKIVLITGKLASGQQPEFMNQAYANQILGLIKSNMKSLGYNEVTDTTQADFFFLPAAMEVTNYSYYYWGDYWGWYYPGGGYYYTYPVVTSYTTGTLLMNLVDRKTFSPDNKNAVPWIALINGLLQDYGGTSAATRITNTVNQAFEQSADYLHQ